MVAAWLFGGDAVGAPLLCGRILGVNVNHCRRTLFAFFFVFFFRHGRGPRRVGERDGEVDGKGRARDDFERGVSNVRADESSDALSKRTRVTVGPVVLGGGVVVSRVFLW